MSESSAAVGLLRDDRDWRKFLGARLISLAGTSVTYVAFPVIVYSLTKSPFLTALVAALEALPYLVFGLLAGALADRFDRKRLMVFIDLVNAVVLATIPVASWFGVLTVAHLLVAAFVVPALFVFFDAADFGAIPTLVGRVRIATANSAMWGASTVVETAVPLLAAASFALIAPASLITLNALTYVASALLIRAVVRPLSDPARRPNAPLSRRALVADVREGLSFLWRHTTVRSMTLVAATQSVAGGAFMGQLIPWAATSLHVREGNWRLGVLFATWGIGVLLATVFVPRLVRRVGAARVTLLILPFSAVLCALTALSANWVSGSIALLFWGAAYMGVVLNTITYRQQVTPEPLMSRVNTTGRMLSFGLGSPIGALLGGAVAQLSQPRNGILAGAAVTVVGVSVAWLSPLRREGVQPAIVPV